MLTYYNFPLSYFEKWIFHGLLEDRTDELFIGLTTECAPCTARNHWQHAYHIKPRSVPGFLHGTEELTLLCGKYTMLLKAIRPNHPLLAAPHIAIDVCLTNAQTSQLRAKCLAYRNHMRTVCGPAVSVRDIFQQRTQTKRENTERASTRFHENMARWQAEQAAKSDVMREEHARTRRILEKQMSEVHERKVSARLESLELDRMHVANAERLEAERTVAENEERLKRIAYYTELGELVDKQRSDAASKVVQLQETLRMERAKTERMATELLSGKPMAPIEDANKNPVGDGIANDEQLSEVGRYDANQNVSDAAAHNRMAMQRSTFDFQHHESGGHTASSARVAVVCLNDDNSNPVLALKDAQSAQSTSAATTTAHLEMLQNRSKVMGDQRDLFARIYAAPHPPRVLPTNPDQMSDLQRNRHKIMTEEYGIVPFQSTPAPRLHLPLALESPDDDLALVFATPMSTSSDTPNKHFSEALSTTADTQLTLDIPSTPSGRSSPSVYDTAESGAIDEQGFEFPTDCRPTEASAARSHYLRSPRKTKFFEKKPVAPNDQHVLDELAQPTISSITQSLRLSFILPLQAHFNVLNAEVLKVFLVDFNIISHFKSLRNYFFMMDGEFASHICDGLLDKLEANVAPPDVLKFSTLHSLLDSALGSSIIGQDPNAANLSFIVTDMPKRFRLDSPDVLHMLRLCYDVQWPLSIVLNTAAMAQYETIFGYLLKLRRIRYILERTSQRLKDVTKGAGPRCLRSPQYRYVQQIRNRLLQIINGLQKHITSNALVASWRTFTKELERAVSIEDLCRLHTRYLDRVVFLCMLDNHKSRDFNKNLDKIWVISLRFY